MSREERRDDAWQQDIYRVLKAFSVKQICFVPDGGHAGLIQFFENDAEVHSTLLTTEEEGVAQCAGAWLGGDRAALLVQSSGVGNCINMLSLVQTCKLPFLMLVAMRGEWGEFNPWQVPMGSVTAAALELMGVNPMRVEQAAEVEETVHAAATMAYDGHSAVAVLLSQKLIGAKQFSR